MSILLRVVFLKEPKLSRVDYSISLGEVEVELEKASQNTSSSSDQGLTAAIKSFISIISDVCL